MTNMNDQESKKPSNDDLISSYLGDIFGEDVERLTRSESWTSDGESVANAYIFAKPTVAPDHTLTKTVNLASILSSKDMQSKPQAFLLLLFSLRFLQQPMTKRVRGLFLSLGERMIDDYEAAGWSSQMSQTGVLSEARQ